MLLVAGAYIVTGYEPLRLAQLLLAIAVCAACRRATPAATVRRDAALASDLALLLRLHRRKPTPAAATATVLICCVHLLHLILLPLLLPWKGRPEGWSSSRFPALPETSERVDHDLKATPPLLPSSLIAPLRKVLWTEGKPWCFPTSCGPGGQNPAVLAYTCAAHTTVYTGVTPATSLVACHYSAVAPVMPRQNNCYPARSMHVLERGGCSYTQLSVPGRVTKVGEERLRSSTGRVRPDISSCEGMCKEPYYKGPRCTVSLPDPPCHSHKYS